MTLYTLMGADSTEWFLTKREALARARAVSRELEAEVTVERATLVPMTRANVCGILNTSGGRCVEESAVVATVRAGRVVAEK